MSDRILYVCGCGTVGKVASGPACIEAHVTPCRWMVLDAIDGRTCYECHQRVQAINIDQLVRERDGLLDGRTQAEGQRSDAEAEARKSRAECIRLQAENERLRDELEIAKRGLRDVADLINESRGVLGFLNVDIAYWDELEHGDYAVWLAAFSAARALLASKEQES